MSYLFDAHVHSNISKDGKSSFTDYLKAANQKDITEIGFSEHIDFLPECGSYNFVDFEEYLRQISELKAQGYNVFAGAEIDYVSDVKQEIAEHLNRYKYDYTISSVHMINRESISDGKIKGFDNENALKWFLICYYAEVRESLTMPHVTVLGHVGVYKRQMWEYISKHKEALDLIDELEKETATLCMKLGIIVEVNSSALFSSYKSTLADGSFLKHYYDIGGRKVTVGSDAHKADNLYRGINDCIGLLKSIGFDEIITPWNGQKISI